MQLSWKQNSDRGYNSPLKRTCIVICTMSLLSFHFFRSIVDKNCCKKKKKIPHQKLTEDAMSMIKAITDTKTVEKLNIVLLIKIRSISSAVIHMLFNLFSGLKISGFATTNPCNVKHSVLILV